MEKKNRSVISIIVPVYNQEKTVREDIKNILKTMSKIRHSYEVIAVVDGAEDNSLQELRKISSKNLQVFGYSQNQGKGNAVRYGMARSKGDIVAFIDSGMDINPNGISLLLEHFEWYKADIVVGSKLHPASRVSYPLQRRVLSWGYRNFVRVLFGLTIKDTQVGLKLFSREIVQDVLPRLLVKAYAFDIELLAVSYYLGYKRIYEAPVELDFTGVSGISSKSFWRVILHMLWDTIAVFYRLRILRYYDKVNKKNWKSVESLQVAKVI